MDFLNPLISAIAGLAGVSLGGFIAGRNDRARRRAEFVTKQLSEFYGPLLSLRSEIRARGELRVRIQNAVHQVWQETCAELKGAPPEVVKKATDDRRPQVDANIKYENDQLTNTLIPAYRQMLALFREKMWLAEPQTRTYLNALVEFVDVWERSLQDAIHGDVIEVIGHSESNLDPLYRHVEETVDRLRNELLRSPN